MSSNRAILLTPPGVAAIAVVRIAGPGTAEFLHSRFSRVLQPSRPVHGILRDETGEQIDDPVIVLSSDKQSADINLHGGAWVVRATLNLAQRAGFECTKGPTLPLSDFAIDSADLIQREIEAHLPLATTELALRTLLAQADAWRALQARTVILSYADIAAILADRSLHWLLNPPRVAIVGAANVGKSTLANRLFAQERSITADVPGTTRDWVGEMANLDGLAIQLVDTPGIRQTTDDIERQAIERSRQQIERADLVILVLDASRPLEGEQTFLIKRFPESLRVVNKVDAKVGWDISAINAVQTVGTTGSGVDELMRRIRAHFNCETIDPNRARCWTQRQRDLILTIKPKS
jgi:tRNA modification GTPase